MNARYSGTGDAVEWDPDIIYTSIAADTYAGEDLRHYRCSSDHIAGEMSAAPLAVDGTVSYEGSFSKQKTGDDLTLSVVRTDKTGKQTEVGSLFLPADTVLAGNFRANSVLRLQTVPR